ncbi:MAG: metal ABC transporter substrate-binding protein [Clostridiaceae bacterium]|nr:metal ABC transporter substrate-binding protein [Clostridiaceae bacterium]
MLKFKKIISLISAAALIVTMTACSSTKEKVTKQTTTIGLMPSVDAVPFIVADEKGYFKNHGLDVKLQVFKSAKDRDAAFQSGVLDGVTADEVAVSLYQNSDFNVKITGVTDGDFMLVASKASGIKSIKDIKGKSAAISDKTVIEYTLDKILEKNSMKPEDIKKELVPAIPTRVEMLRNNKIDLALLPEPFSTLAIKDGGVLLANARNLGMSPGISAFTEKSIASKGKEIKELYKAYDEAVQYINDTPISQYEDIVIKAAGYPKDMKGKINLPKFRKNALPSEEELKLVIDWTKNKGLVKKDLSPKDLVNDIAIK